MNDDDKKENCKVVIIGNQCPNSNLIRLLRSETINRKSIVVNMSLEEDNILSKFGTKNNDDFIKKSICEISPIITKPLKK